MVEQANNLDTYSLTELLEQCQGVDMALSEEDKAWLDSPSPVEDEESGEWH